MKWLVHASVIVKVSDSNLVAGFFWRSRKKRQPGVMMTHHPLVCQQDKDSMGIIPYLVYALLHIQDMYMHNYNGAKS